MRYLLFAAGGAAAALLATAYANSQDPAQLTGGKTAIVVLQSSLSNGLTPHNANLWIGAALGLALAKVTK